MELILIGAGFMFAGVVLAAIRTAGRGTLSERPDSSTNHSRDTIEPKGRGKWLSVKTDLSGAALFVLGAFLIFMGLE